MARRIAVLGGGMLGVCTALELVRRGERVSIIDGCPELMQGASRWNEGKIHLGYLYAADTALGTAERLIPGALAFAPLVERHVGRALDDFCTIDDTFILHRRSVVDLESFSAYAGRVAEMAAQVEAGPVGDGWGRRLDGQVGGAGPASGQNRHQRAESQTLHDPNAPMPVLESTSARLAQDDITKRKPFLQVIRNWRAQISCRRRRNAPQRWVCGAFSRRGRTTVSPTA